VISGEEVKLGQEPRTAELIQQFLNHCYGKFVLDCSGVKDSIVDAETPFLVALVDQ
jgi:hypothetical protein